MEQQSFLTQRLVIFGIQVGILLHLYSYILFNRIYNFKKGEPNSANIEYCIEMFSMFDNGLFNDASCDGYKLATCKISEIALCSSGWVLYGTHCYNLFPTYLNHEAAEAFCPSQVENSYLVQIDSFDEFQWLLKFYLGSGDPVWV